LTNFNLGDKVTITITFTVNDIDNGKHGGWINISPDMYAGNIEDKRDFIERPTYQMHIDWLRKVPNE